MATQLVAAGVDRNDISLMADWNTVIEKLGLTYPDPGAVVDNPETPRRRLERFPIMLDHIRTS